MSLKQTPSQTIGPYFAYAMTPEAYGKMGIASYVIANDEVQGKHIHLSGTVLDGDSQPINDALVEIWQADANGDYIDSHSGKPQNFTGFGRCQSGENGEFEFITIKPGAIASKDGSFQAPHLNVIVFARGMLSHAYSRVYFADETILNAGDSLFGSIEPARQQTLLASTSDGERFHWDIHLQGNQETVFLDV